MFYLKEENGSTTGQRWLFYAFLLLCSFLPFQFALNPMPGFDLAIVRVIIPIIFLFFLFSGKHLGFSFARNSSLKLIVCFLFLAVLSLLYSNQLFWSVRKLLFLLSIFPIFLLAQNLLNSKAKQCYALIFLINGAALLALIAIIQFSLQFIFGIDPVYNFFAKYSTSFFLGHSFSQMVLSYPSWLVNSGGRTFLRATAVFPDPHMLSYYFGILIPWAIAIWANSQKHKRYFLSVVILLILADIFTFTRGGYLALIAGIISVTPLVSRKTLIKISFGSLLLLFLFFIAPQSPVANRLSSSFDVQEGSNQGRIYNWKQALPIIKDKPQGVGIGMYSLTVSPDSSYREPIYAHNLYLDIAAELGILAALVFISLLAITIINFWRAARMDSFFIAGVASVTIFGVHSLVETPLYSVHILSLILIIIGIGSHVAIHKKASGN